MIITLTVTKGADEGKVFRLGDGDSRTIGRGSQADISLTDASASRLHCRLRAENGAALLGDLGSRNGTAVNGLKISGEARLADGDVIELGFSRLTVAIGTGALRPPKMEVKPGPANVEPHPARPAFVSAEDVVVSAMTPLPSAPATVEAPSALRLRGVTNDLSGQTIGGCRIERLISEDDTAQVYLAVQVSMERKVALKVLQPAMARNRRAVDNFLKTARDGGRLSHPNIVQVYDAGEEHGVYYIAIEHTGGKTVERMLDDAGRNRPLALRAAVEIAEQIAGALSYIHGQKVFHRRVNPPNIVVNTHNIAKLANLGFASASTNERERVAGIPYQAPELLEVPELAAPAMDIYSLGAVLFVMAAGVAPFRGSTAKELADRVRRGARESARQSRRDVPEPVLLIIDKAMQLEPADRYVSAADMQADLSAAREKLHL